MIDDFVGTFSYSHSWTRIKTVLSLSDEKSNEKMST